MADNGESVRIRIYRGASLRAEATAGIDRLYARNTGDDTGWISSVRLADDREAAMLLFREIAAAQASWGAKGFAGPVPPDGSAFGEGVLTEGFGEESGPLNPTDPPWHARFFREAGFAEEKAYFGYALDVSAIDEKYARCAEYAARRFGVETKAEALDRRCARAMYRVLGGDAKTDEDAFGRVCASVAEKCRTRVIVARREGEAAGFMLLLFPRWPGKTARVATCWVKKELRDGSILTPMIACAASVLQRERQTRADVSVIDGDNVPSAAAICRLGGARTRKYVRFHYIL